jgi:hypothetical protein
VLIAQSPRSMELSVLRVTEPLGVLAVLIGMAALAKALGRRRRSSATALDRPWPLECEPHLLSEREQILYHRLVKAAPEHIVLMQVLFLIVTADTSILAAVELDDASHDREDRRAADARKTHALESAGISLLRWNVRQMPSVQTIRANLAMAFRRAS